MDGGTGERFDRRFMGGNVNFVLPGLVLKDVRLGDGNGDLIFKGGDNMWSCEEVTDSKIKNAKGVDAALRTAELFFKGLLRRGSYRLLSCH